MIKKCEIISQNPFLNILVVDFDGRKIQMTGSVNKNAKFVYVKYENDVATVSSLEEYEQSKKQNKSYIPNKAVKPEIEKENLKNLG